MEMNKMNMLVKDIDERLIEGWANLELKDLQGDYIPVDSMKRAMIKYVERGGAINYRHTNHVIGKVLSFWVDKNNENIKGVKILAKVYSDDELMDKAWDEVKQGEIKGFSIGGIVKSKKGDVLNDISIHEISLVEKPANPEALIESHTFAKGENIEKDCKDEYMADKHNFKEMTCPGNSGEKSKFCGCVRYQVSCNGKSEESARKICAEIYHAKYGGEDKDVDVDSNVEKMDELRKPFGVWSSFEDCVNYMKEEEGYDEDVAKKVCGSIEEKLKEKSFIKWMIMKFSYNTENFKYDDAIKKDEEEDNMEGNDVKPKPDKEPVIKEDENEQVEQPTTGKMDILVQTMAEINDKLAQLLEKFNAIASPPTEEAKGDKKDDEYEEDDDEESKVEKMIKKDVPNFVKVETPVEAGVDFDGTKKESSIRRILKGEIGIDEALKESGGR